MLRAILAILYFGVFYKVIDYIFYRSALPTGLLLNCLEIFALGVALAISVALATFTANKIKKANWFES